MLFGLATDIGDTDRRNPAFADFVERFPEHRSFSDEGTERDLAFVPTVFDQLSADLVAALVYRGWWLTGASLALHQPDFAPLPSGDGRAALSTPDRPRSSARSTAVR